MAYLFFQTGVWLLLAFVLGLLIGGLLCWLCCRAKQEENDDLRRQLAALQAKSADAGNKLSNSGQGESTIRAAVDLSESVDNTSTETEAVKMAQVEMIDDAVEDNSKEASDDGHDEEQEKSANTVEIAVENAAETSDAADSVAAVTFFTEPPEDIDDLKRIKGVGPVLEKTLNQLGIYQFAQIAAFDEKDIAYVNDSLSFSGRIEREEWVQQAAQLSAGEATEFAKRVDKGDVEY